MGSTCGAREFAGNESGALYRADRPCTQNFAMRRRVRQCQKTWLTLGHRVQRPLRAGRLLCNAPILPGKYLWLPATRRDTPSFCPATYQYSVGFYAPAEHRQIGGWTAHSRRTTCSALAYVP